MCNGPKSYLKDVWNVLDFCIVLVSLVMLTGIEVSRFGIRIPSPLSPWRMDATAHLSLPIVACDCSLTVEPLV